jgi:hypothetical protein
MTDVKRRLLKSRIEATSSTRERLGAYSGTGTNKRAKVVNEAAVKVNCDRCSNCLALSPGVSGRDDFDFGRHRISNETFSMRLVVQPLEV